MSYDPRWRPPPQPAGGGLQAPASKPGTAMDRVGGGLGAAIVGCCVLLVVGSLLSWATVSAGGESVRGVTGTTSGKGIFTLLVGVVAAAVWLSTMQQDHGRPGHVRSVRGVAIGLAVAAGVELIVLLTVLSDLRRLSAVTQTFSFGGVSVDPGPGLILALVADLGLLATSIAVIARSGAAKSGPVGRQAPAGWYPDPSGQRRLRWWNGTGWSDHQAG